MKAMKAIKALNALAKVQGREDDDGEDEYEHCYMPNYPYVNKWLASQGWELVGAA